MVADGLHCLTDLEPAPPEGGPPVRVRATPAALLLIQTLTAQHGPVLFHQSGGCCDGSSPMCYPRSDFIIGDQDVELGTIGEAPVFISRSQFDVWRHTQLIIDVVPGRGGMFSLENGTEQRFLTRSRAFTPDQLAILDGAPPTVGRPEALPLDSVTR